MTARIFLGSTTQDLGEDCRRSALRSIHRAEAVAISMENWVGEFVDCVALCRRKIEIDSTHYLGIFAYRRGWVPPGSDQSITEIELEQAQQSKKRMAVLMPEGGTVFAAELRQRARDQSPEEKAAQDALRERLWSEGYCQSFADLPDFEGRVAHLALSWNHEGLRRFATAAPAAPGGTLRPGQILSLGRREQVRDFLQGLRLARAGRLSRAAAFVVHGPGAAGQRQLVSRLRGLIEEGTEIRTGRIDCAATWRGRGPEQTLLVLGRDLAPEGALTTPASLARRLRDHLAITTVVLEVFNVQGYDGGLPAFVEQIWKPLVRNLGRTSHPLVGLFTLDRSCPEAWRGDLHDLRAEGEERFAGEVPILLPLLGPFTVEDLLDWLLDHLSAEDAHLLAEDLLAETAGEPEALYRRLADLPL